MEHKHLKKKKVSLSHLKSLNNVLGGMLHATACSGDKNKLRALLLVFPQDIDMIVCGRTPLISSIISGQMSSVQTLLELGANPGIQAEGGQTALHWAVTMSFEVGVKLLLKYGCNPCIGDELGRTALHLAAANCNSTLLSMLLKRAGKPLAGQLAKVELEDRDKQTPLHISATCGRVDNVRLLLKYSASTSVIDNEGRIPLHRAAACRETTAVSCIEVLMNEYPSSVMWQDFNGWTPFHHAVVSNNTTALTALISRGTSPLNIADHNYRTPLHLAAMLGLTDMFKFLLTKGVDWKKTDFNGATPVHYAARKRHTETLRALLSELPALCDVPDSAGMTPLMWSSACSAEDVINILLELGAEIHTQDLYGSTALHAAVQAGGYAAINLLLSKGADPNSQDSMGHSVLSLACQLGWNHVVTSLLEHGARHDVRDNAGRTPLHWAAFSGHHSIVKHLLTTGVDPDIHDFTGSTPLHDAASRGQKSCISLLVQHGAQLNRQDNNGLTALHVACVKGSLELVKFLLDLGAHLDTFTLTKQGWLAPLDIAMRSNHREMAHLLYRHGAMSIITVRETAAARIQACYRRYRTRKNVRASNQSSTDLSELITLQPTKRPLLSYVTEAVDDVTKSPDVHSTTLPCDVDFSVLSLGEVYEGKVLERRNYALELVLSLMQDCSLESSNVDLPDTLTLTSLENKSNSDYIALMAAEQERASKEMYEDLRNTTNKPECSRTVHGNRKVFEVTTLEAPRIESHIPPDNEEEEEVEIPPASRRPSSLFSSFKFFRTRNLFSRFSKRKEDLYFGHNVSDVYTLPELPVFTPSPSVEDLEARSFMLKVRFISKEQKQGSQKKCKSKWKKVWRKRSELEPNGNMLGVRKPNKGKRGGSKTEDYYLLSRFQCYLKCMDPLPPLVRENSCAPVPMVKL